MTPSDKPNRIDASNSVQKSIIETQLKRRVKATFDKGCFYSLKFQCSNAKTDDLWILNLTSPIGICVTSLGEIYKIAG